jgi:hypothetical protein
MSKEKKRMLTGQAYLEYLSQYLKTFRFIRKRLKIKGPFVF